MHKTAAWRVGPDQGIRRLEDVTPMLEKHLEEWIEKDSEIVGCNLLIIGRQQETSFGSIVDLLAVDTSGDLIIVELKRDRTPREIVAQSLEYAAWVSRLGYEDIMDIASKKFGGPKGFQDAYLKRFGTAIPETVNQAQRIVLVAPEITEGVASVVEYLAETFGVPINAVTFGLKIGEETILIPMSWSAKERRLGL